LGSTAIERKRTIKVLDANDILSLGLSQQLAGDFSAARATDRRKRTATRKINCCLAV